MVWLSGLVGFISVWRGCSLVAWLIVWLPGFVGLALLRGFFGFWVDGVVVRFGWFLSVLEGLFFGCLVDSMVARFGWFISVGVDVLWLLG